MSRLFVPVLSALFLVMLAACETTTSGGAVGADRPQLMLVSSQQLEQMGAQSYAKLLADAGRKGVLNRDGGMLQRVRAVASRIEPQTAVFRRDAPGWKWEVNLLASDELNAFCMPGGGRAPEFLSSHPADASRVQQIAALLPTVMPLYQAALGRR